MNKYLKKFGIMFVMTLAIIGIGAIQNGVLAKAATVGSALTSPESGWTRYDDTNTKIKYVGGWGNSSFTPYYGGTMHYTTGTGKNNYAKIKFYGSEFRLIGKRDVNSSILNINIDGKDYLDDNTTPSSSNIWQALTFEKRDLGFGVHDVTITNIKSKHMQIDAIDIDNTGYLIDPNESITLDKSSMNLNVGDSQKLAATTVPAGAQVTWTSSDGSIVTVDPNGNVTGVSGGTCTITATTADGLTATCTANVNKEDESITLDKSSMELNQGDSGQLTATVSTTTNAQVTWTSSNPSAATVDSTGKVTAIGAGTATITATTTDGSNLSASCTVNVTANDGGNNGGTTTGASAIVNIAYAKGDNTNNAGGEVSIIFNGAPDTTLSVVKTANVKSVWVGDTFTYTIVVTNTGSKIAKAVVINDSAPNHIQFMPSGITTTQGTVDSSSSASKIVVNVGDIPPAGTVTITVPATVVL